MPGRCAGCGKTDTAEREILQHILSCDDFLALYRRDPSKALSPKREYERWRREEMSKEAKDARKADRLDARFAELDRQRKFQSERFQTPRDPLED